MISVLKRNEAGQIGREEKMEIRKLKTEKKDLTQRALRPLSSQRRVRQPQERSEHPF